VTEKLEAAAALFDDAAAELEEAAKHARTAARHFRNGEVPRGAAHAWAVYGHVQAATESLAAQAREHARESNP